MSKPKTDEFHGRGGAYVVVDGQRVRQAAAPSTPPKAPAKPAAPKPE